MDDNEICQLCLRPLGRRREKHHLVPRTFGGRETIELHPICHRKIHSVLSERELAHHYNDPARLRGHPDIESFIGWLAGKPADFHKLTRPSGRKRRRP